MNEQRHELESDTVNQATKNAFPDSKWQLEPTVTIKGTPPLPQLSRFQPQSH